jgi:uncharacterized membrane protein
MGVGQIVLGFAFGALALAPLNKVRGGEAGFSLAAALADGLPALLGLLAATVLLGCVAGLLLVRRAWRTRETWPVGESGGLQIPSRARRDLTFGAVASSLAVAAAVFLLILVIPPIT